MVEELNVDIDLIALKDLFQQAWTYQAWSMSYPTIQSGICVNDQEPNNYLNSCGGGFSFEQERSFNSLHSFHKDNYLVGCVEKR